MASKTAVRTYQADLVRFEIELNGYESPTDADPGLSSDALADAIGDWLDEDMPLPFRPTRVTVRQLDAQPMKDPECEAPPDKAAQPAVEAFEKDPNWPTASFFVKHAIRMAQNSADEHGSEQFITVLVSAGVLQTICDYVKDAQSRAVRYLEGVEVRDGSVWFNLNRRYLKICTPENLHSKGVEEYRKHVEEYRKEHERTRLQLIKAVGSDCGDNVQLARDLEAKFLAEHDRAQALDLRVEELQIQLASSEVLAESRKRELVEVRSKKADLAEKLKHFQERRAWLIEAEGPVYLGLCAGQYKWTASPDDALHFVTRGQATALRDAVHHLLPCLALNTARAAEHVWVSP